MVPKQLLGRSGIETTALGVGGHLGLLTDSNDPAQRRAEAIRAVRRATELGVRYFDTSPMYGGGESELHLGAGLAALDGEMRAQLTVSTKVGTHPDRPHAYGADDVRWCYENSRQILGPIDIVFVHDPSSDADMDVIMGPGGALEVLEELRTRGEIRAIGLGNRTHRWQRHIIDSGRADVILPSYDYHPIRQSMAPLLDHAHAANVGVVNGSPYQSGLLAGIDLEALAASQGENPDIERARQIYAWCRAQNIEVGALAVQFSMREPRISATLVGPRTVAELEDNLRHATASISEAQWAAFAAFLADLQPPAAPGGEAL
jgi:D-threo-aldose 1-dehydrogenase